MFKSPFSDAVIPEIPIHNELFKKMIEHGDKVALVHGITGEEWSFRQLVRLSQRIASGLVRLGVHQNDVIAFCAPNIPQYPMMLLATWAVGAIATTINPIYTKYELTYQFKDTGAKWLFTTKDILPTAREACREYHGIQKIITEERVPGCVTVDELAQDDGSLYPSSLIINPREQLAILPYSSGTTGLPKGVMITHYNLVTQMAQFNNDDARGPPTPEAPEPVVMAVLPFFHVFGLVAVLSLGLNNGAKLICLPKYDLRMLLQLIEKYKINLLPVVPPILVAMIKSPMTAEFDLSSLLRVASGAAPLKANTSEEFVHKIPVMSLSNGWGMTEITCGGTTLGYNNPPKMGSVGFLHSNLEGKFVDRDTGKICGPNVHGELCVKGPSVMKGYLNNPKATAETIDKDGFVHTGDIGYYDEEGYLFIVDRIKELIKYKGFQVAPAELEALLLTNMDVFDAGVIGVPNPEAGEHPLAFVVRKPGSRVSSSELEKFIEERVAPYKRLRGGVIFTNEIPKTATGKIMRRKLADMAATGKSKL